MLLPSGGRDLGEHGGPLGEGARFAFAVLYELAAAARRTPVTDAHGLVVVVKWGHRSKGGSGASPGNPPSAVTPFRTVQQPMMARATSEGSVFTRRMRSKLTAGKRARAATVEKLAELHCALQRIPWSGVS